MRGVSLDALNTGPGTPTMRQLALLAKPAGHRLVAFDDPRFYQYVGQLQGAGFGVALVLTSQSFDMTRPLGPQCQRWAQAVHPSMWIAGNEFNIQGDASWPTSPADFVAMWNVCAPALKASGVPVYTGGMFCGDGTEDLIQSLWPQLHTVPDGVDFHPYLVVPDFHRVRINLKCGISAGEWNDATPEGIRSFQQVLDTETDHSFFFCFHDSMVAPYGLVRADGGRKSTWYAYREALS